MQRVVSINLNGNAYQIEENGYNALFAYLDAAETAFKDSPERATKLADLERIIAEKCQACLAPHKTVVTSAEIDRILLELEPVQAKPAAEPAATSSASSSGASSGTGYTHRRLFQVREGAMISGVCVGLSEFLHIDVTLIRILFVVFALVTAGWGMLAYGILMFVAPRVDTRAEASTAAATGTIPPHRWPWDDGWPWDKHGWPWDHPVPEQQKAPQQNPNPQEQRQAWREQRHAWRNQRREWRAQHPRPVFSTISMIVLLMFAFFWLSFWTRGHFFFGFPFFWGFPHWIGIILFFMMLRLIFLPFRAARWYGYGPYGPYAHPHYAWAAMWSGLAWFLVVIFAVWVAFHYVPEFHDFIRSFDSTLSVSSFHV